MSYIPATLRQSGYSIAPASGSHRVCLCSLPSRPRRLLTTFVADQPARVLAKFILSIATERLTFEEVLHQVEQWRDGLPSEALHVVGGNRLPSRALRSVPR